MKQFLTIIILITFSACNQNNRTDATTEDELITGSAVVPDEFSTEETLIKHIESAHNKDAWEERKAVAFNIDLKIGGESRLQGKITTLTNSAGIRIDKRDGTKVVYNGNEVFICPADASEKGARFDVFTWQYFFALPFKFSDEGTQLQMLDPKKIGGENFNTARLSFKENTGDTPDDWYILYQEPDTGLLHAAAYIVTYNSPKQEAEKNPHAIVYRDYVAKEGVPVSTRWTFHHWSEQEGIGEQIGEANLSNIVFFNAEDELFEEPENSKAVDK